VQEPGRIYRSGDEIDTPASRVAVRGWQLSFHVPSIRAYSAVNGPNFSYLITIPGYAPAAAVTPDQINHTKGEIFEAPTIPPPDGKPLLLLFLVHDGRHQTIEAQTYPIAPTYYWHDYERERDGVSSGRAFVCSEVPLSSDVLANMEYTARLFSHFVAPRTTTYIREAKKDDERSGSYNRNIILLSSDLFTNPRFEYDGPLVLFHEYAHAIVDSIIQRSSGDFREYDRLIQAYRGLLATAGLSFPVRQLLETALATPSQNLEDNPYFSIFDESSYLGKEVAEGFGHPYDNPTELFASALTVLRYFPERFLVRYQSMEPAKRVAVKAVVEVVVQILSSRNRRVMDQLLPQLSTIRAAM
jgi:hypothetical protein